MENGLQIIVAENATDADAKTYGFKVGIKAVGGNVTLKGRSVLAIIG